MALEKVEMYISKSVGTAQSV